VLKEAGRGKSRWKIRDLIADGRCSQAVLDFLSTTGDGYWEAGPTRGRRGERGVVMGALGAQGA